MNDTRVTQSDLPHVGETRPQVSIIINNYNYGRFLADAIDSALNQSHPSVEVIIVDDGSTDSSNDVLSDFCDRAKVILKPNGGQASALNTGFAYSQGDIIIFLDSDDVLDEHAAMIAHRKFRETPDLALVMYRLEVINASGLPTGELKPPEYLPRRSGDVHQQILDFPFDIPRMATSGNAFSRAILTRIMPIPAEDYPRIGADWYLNYTVPLFGPIAFLDDVGGYYRVHGQNNFERAATTVSLPEVRQIIADDQTTARHIARLAQELDLDSAREANDVVSVSFIANRIISLKLDPKRHPIPDDHLFGLIMLGLKAASRRNDVTLTMRILFIIWFIAAATGPRALTEWLAIKLQDPASRPSANKLLARLHRA